MSLTARRPRKTQNAGLRPLRSPRALTDRRGIAVGSLRTPFHGAMRSLCMHKVRAVARSCHGDLNERRGNAVVSQQQRSNSVVKSSRAPRERRVHTTGTHMITTSSDCTDTSWSHGYVTVSLPTMSSRRVYGVCIAPTPNIISIQLRPHGDHTELPRRSLQSHGAHTESFAVCRALDGH